MSSLLFLRNCLNVGGALKRRAADNAGKLRAAGKIVGAQLVASREGVVGRFPLVLKPTLARDSELT